MNELIEKVLQWGRNKNIIGSNAKGTKRAQANKMLEECNETRDAVLLGVYQEEDWSSLRTDDETLAEIEDGIGDVFVTAILLAEMHGMTSEQCLQAAYDVISKRTGVMSNGTFVKDVPANIDDDLGELDSSKACKIDNTDCESCS